MTSINLKAVLTASASLIALAAWNPAQAQPARPAAGPATETATAAPNADVGEIIVTARRRAESAQAVPIALSVTTAEDLERTGVSTINQLTQLAPSIQVLSPNARNTAITIRGLGASTGLANDGLEQGVGVYIDQVYNARPATATFDFVDIERIEVLRGPQGTLFGKNTTAGALNITTRPPSFTPEGQAEVTFGNFNYIQGKAAFSGPIVGDVLAARVSIVGTSRDGLLYNTKVGRDQNEIKNIAYRGALLFKPNANLKITLSGDYSRQEPECCTQVYVTAGATLKPLTQQYAALAAGLGYRPPSTNPYDHLTDVDSAIQARQTLKGVSGIVDYDLGKVTLTSISAYRTWIWGPKNDRDYTALDIVRQSANPSKQWQFSQEVRLGSNGSNIVDWTVGLYYFDQNITTNGVTEYGSAASYWLLPTTNSPSALLDGYTVFNNSSIDTKSYAAFGQATWNVTDRFRLTPGLRYTDDKKHGAYAATTTGGLVTTDATLLTRRLGIARPQSYAAALTDGSFSGQIVAAYDLAPDLHAYASYSRGFKSAGINMAGLPTTAAGLPALTSAVVKPEATNAYELGLKSQLFDRLLTANLAAFYNSVGNYQANVVDAGPGALRGYLANVKKVKVKGFEADLSTRSIGGFTAYLNLAWTDGEYASFTNGPCPLERIGASTAACDLSGKELPGVSRWAGAGGIEYRRDARLAAVDGEVFAGFDANFRSPYYGDATDSVYTRIRGYGIVNLRAGFKANKTWEAFAWVRNAFDKGYLQLVTVQTGNSGLVTGTPGDQRTFGVTVRAHY